MRGLQRRECAFWSGGCLSCRMDSMYFSVVPLKSFALWDRPRFKLGSPVLAPNRVQKITSVIHHRLAK